VRSDRIIRREPMHGGFVLDQPNIQVFERKLKEPKSEATSAQVHGERFCIMIRSNHPNCLCT
jgi:hypothetical protein